MEMDGASEKEGGRPHLLDLIPNGAFRDNVDEQKVHGCLEEKRLELSLGPPGQGWSNRKDSTKISKERDESLLSITYFSSISSATDTQNSLSSSAKPVETVSGASPYFPFPSTPRRLPAIIKEVDLQNRGKHSFLPSFPDSSSPNSSQKRSASGPVVGWPPIRAFRKNLTNASSSSSKPASESHIVGKNKVIPYRKGQFVKINMEGVPIGRKVDLSVNDSYKKLFSAVDELFRELLSDQRDSEDGGVSDPERILGLVDRSGEYTLVYEDNEGDQMLAGDVPWQMFVSSVKRLRVLKSSEISASALVNAKGRQNVV